MIHLLGDLLSPTIIGVIAEEVGAYTGMYFLALWTIFSVILNGVAAKMANK